MRTQSRLGREGGVRLGGVGRGEYQNTMYTILLKEDSFKKGKERNKSTPVTRWTQASGCEEKERMVRDDSES